MSGSTRKNIEVIGATVALILLILLAAMLTGCARFSTKQTDLSYDNQGKPQRQITTTASAYTLWTAKSSLATWKATQTDKSQGATVGNLAQESNSTNAAAVFEAIGKAVVNGLAPVAK